MQKEVHFGQKDTSFDPSWDSSVSTILQYRSIVDTLGLKHADPCCSAETIIAQVYESGAIYNLMTFKHKWNLRVSLYVQDYKTNKMSVSITMPVS